MKIDKLYDAIYSTESISGQLEPRSMPERYSLSKVQAVGIFAASIGFIGYVVFGWRFGEADGILPFVLEGVFAGLAIVQTLSQ